MLESFSAILALLLFANALAAPSDASSPRPHGIAERDNKYSLTCSNVPGHVGG